MLREFISSPWETSRTYGGTLSGVSAGVANTTLVLSYGISSAANELTAGLINFSSNGWMVAFGREGAFRYAFPVNAAMGLTSTYVMQFPHLASGNPWTWASCLFFTAGATPSLTEVQTREWACNKLEQWKAAGITLAQRPAVWALKGLANPRVCYGGSSTVCLMPFMANDITAGNYHLVPVYGLWLLGNFFNAISRPALRPALSQPSALRPGD
jgi:hypothetical protein